MSPSSSPPPAPGRPASGPAAAAAETAPPRSGAIAGVALAAVAVGFWLLNSVSAGEAALFVGFELAFVVLPGCLAYLALSGGPRPALRVAVCGAALGYALGVGFYIAASASGANAIFLAWPAVVGIPALVALWRRPRPWIEARSWSRGELAAATFVAGALLLSVAIALSDQAAIPGELYGNRYHHDLLWEVARAGEAKHVWPLDVPSLAGEPLRYHYLANLNEAAIGEFTGIDQALVNFRLAPIPLLLVVVGGLIELGRSLSGRAWGGVLCAVLVLAVGRFDPLPVPPGEFFKNLYLSDSFLFGLALFLPLVCELVDRIRAGAARVGARAGAAGPGARAGPWVVIAILMAGCGGGKATILPVLCGGLGICLAYALWRRREQVRAVAIGLALSVISGVASYLAFYRVEAGKSDLEAVPFAIAKRTGEFVDLNRDLPDASPIRLAAYALESAVGAVEVLAPLIAGLLLVLLVPRLREATEAVLLAGMLLVGALLWSALVQVGGSQIYFLWYPYAAAGALAAAAIVALVEDRGELRRRALRIAAPAAAALLLLAVISPRPFTGVAEPRAEFSGWRNLTFTKGIYEGLVWVRENTPEEAVIAVNNGHSQPKVARNCAYTAFSERRAMLECEYGAMANGAYPPLAALRSRRATHPYERRFLLNERIFRRGDPDAIRAAHERYGVDYLVLDRRFAYHPGSIAALDRAARRVYEGPQVIVYAVELEGETDGAGR